MAGGMGSQGGQPGKKISWIVIKQARVDSFKSNLGESKIQKGQERPTKVPFQESLTLLREAIL